MTEKYEIVFFDASGTLIEVRESVGEIYCRFGARHGIEARPDEVQQTFMRAFRRQPPMSFPADTSLDQLTRLESQWWWSLVREVFPGIEQDRFGPFFDEVYAFFCTDQAWFVFDDVVPALERLRARGMRLAVLSNFDSRLEKLLANLGLTEHFDAIHYSTRMGAEKPDPAIFRAALAQHGVDPDRALHIGDRIEADIVGATAAGIRAVLLDRRQQVTNPEGVQKIARLDELLA